MKLRRGGVFSNERSLPLCDDGRSLIGSCFKRGFVFEHTARLKSHRKNKNKIQLGLIGLINKHWDKNIYVLYFLQKRIGWFPKRITSTLLILVLAIQYSTYISTPAPIVYCVHTRTFIAFRAIAHNPFNPPSSHHHHGAAAQQNSKTATVSRSHDTAAAPLGDKSARAEEILLSW